MESKREKNPKMESEPADCPPSKTTSQIKNGIPEGCRPKIACRALTHDDRLSDAEGEPTFRPEPDIFLARCIRSCRSGTGTDR